MEFRRGFMFMMILTVFVSTGYCDDTDVVCDCTTEITRDAFPPGFLFGASTASYQIEGGIDSRGPNIWDHYTHNYPGRIADLSNADVAADSYNLYKEDIAIAKSLNLDVYRISISWPRILPYGKLNGSHINWEGIDYYNRLINEAIEQGLELYVTLFHFDLPQALEEAYGGFLNKNIVEDFEYYVDVCFKYFGDRIKNWFTLNEPWSYASLGYGTGNLAPGRCSRWLRTGCIDGDSGTEPYWVAHNLLLAHAAAVNLYRNKYQKSQEGRIGITICSKFFVPYDDTRNDDHEAKQRALDFELGWFLHPITFGDYPLSMRYLVGRRLPDFTADETALLRGSYDILGLNYYTTGYALNNPNPFGTPPSYNTDSQVNETYERDGVFIGQGEGWIYIYPKGIRGLLEYIKKNYTDAPIIITENGLCSTRNESDPRGELNDTLRQKFIHDHLCCIHEAIKTDGANVVGYITWSLIDNYEWMSGYTQLYGLYYVDFQSPNLTRIPKASGNWYQSILEKPSQKYSLPAISDQ
ncbi:hypothetical protein LguiA_021832 [Lonicera macranthoides]